MVVTSSCPDETASVYSSRRCVRSSAENTEPEWVTSAIGPGGSAVALEVAERADSAGHVDEPHATGAADQRHPAAACRSASRLAGGGAERHGPAVTARASASDAARRGGRRARRARPGRPARRRSSSDGTHGRSSTTPYAGLTRWTRATPGLRSASVGQPPPNEPVRALAPTTATERASSIRRSRHPARLRDGRRQRRGDGAATGVPERGPGRLQAGDAADPAAGVGRRAGVVEPVDGRAVVGVPGGRAQVEQLLDARARRGRCCRRRGRTPAPSRAGRRRRGR